MSRSSANSLNPAQRAMFFTAAGRAYELLLNNMLKTFPVLPESAHEICEALETLNCNYEVLSCIAALDDPHVDPAITRAIFHRFTQLVKQARKRPAHRPGGLSATLRQFVELAERIYGDSHDAAIERMAKALQVPVSQVRVAARSRTSNSKAENKKK